MRVLTHQESATHVTSEAAHHCAGAERGGSSVVSHRCSRVPPTLSRARRSAAPTARDRNSRSTLNTAGAQACWRVRAHSNTRDFPRISASQDVNLCQLAAMIRPSQLPEREMNAAPVDGRRPLLQTANPLSARHHWAQSCRVHPSATLDSVIREHLVAKRIAIDSCRQTLGCLGARDPVTR